MSSNTNAVNPVTSIPPLIETHAAHGHGGKGGHNHLNPFNTPGNATPSRPLDETRPAATILISSEDAHTAPPRTPVQLEGFVADLTPVESGGQFTLQGEGSHHVSVAYNEETRFQQSDGSIFSLANGQYVQVGGILDRQTKTVNATTIERTGTADRLGDLRV